MPAAQFFLPRASTPAGLLDFRGCTLVMPAVSCGNIGQLAIDLLLCSLVKTPATGSTSGGTAAGTKAVHKVGTVLSRYVEPVACRRDYGLKSFGQVSAGVEVFRVGKGKGGTVLLHQRAVVCPGGARAYAAQLGQWIAASGFASVVLLGGASAAGRNDSQLAAGGTQFRFLTGPTPLDADLDARIAAMGLPRIRPGADELRLTGLLKPMLRVLDPAAAPIAAAAAAATEPIDPLAMAPRSLPTPAPEPTPSVATVATSAGEAVPPAGGAAAAAAEAARGVPVLACLLYCMEGINFGQGAQMAQCIDHLLHVLPPQVDASAAGAGTVAAAAAEGSAPGGGGGAGKGRQGNEEGAEGSGALLPPGWHIPATWNMPLARPDPALY